MADLEGTHHATLWGVNECGVFYLTHSTGMTLDLCIVHSGGHGPGELGIWVSRCLAFATME